MPTQGGALWPVTQIGDSDLEANGGSYVLSSSAAVRVTRFTTEERAVIDGPATAVYIVSQAQVNAGEFTVLGNLAGTPVFLVTGRPVVGKTAQPIFITEDR